MTITADPRLFPKQMLDVIIDDDRLEPMDKLVAVVVHNYFRNHENRRPLNEAAGIGKRKLENHLKRLEEIGYISRATGKIAPGSNYPELGYWM